MEFTNESGKKISLGQFVFARTCEVLALSLGAVAAYIALWL